MQLDRNHVCEVIRFPIDPMLWKVRQAARIMEIRKGPSADRFWQLEVRRLESSLIVKGTAKDAIARELQAFADAVGREMRAARQAAEANAPHQNDNHQSAGAA